MREQLEQRLNELKIEFEAGQKMIVDLEKRRANLSESLLRISGAIQVLKEEIAKYGQAEDKSRRQEASNAANVEKLITADAAVGMR